jgi:hypothetical protein
VPVVSKIGSRLPMHATGVGKILLAYASDDVQRVVLSDLRRITPYTITQTGRLRHDLARARQQGFAQTSEEMSLGACSVAVPVRGAATTSWPPSGSSSPACDATGPGSSRHSRWPPTASTAPWSTLPLNEGKHWVPHR